MKIDIDTLQRYIRSFIPIADLTFVSEHQISNGSFSKIDDVVTTDPLIIPAKDIEGFADLGSKNFDWFFIKGENIPGLKRKQLLFILDFNLEPHRHALTFGFDFTYDQKWIRSIIEANRVAILPGPYSSVMSALSIDFGATPLSLVNEWLQDNAMPTDEGNTNVSDNSNVNSNSSNCFVATVCMGSSEHPIVLELRRFRDQNLAPTFLGGLFIKFYYLFSPSVAKLIDDNDRLKKIFRPIVILIAKIIMAFKNRATDPKS